MSTYETSTVRGTYGKGAQPTDCVVHCCTVDYSGDKGYWYCIDGSENICRSPIDLDHGVDTELLQDVESFAAADPITSGAQLAAEVLEYIDD